MRCSTCSCGYQAARFHFEHFFISIVGDRDAERVGLDAATASPGWAASVSASVDIHTRVPLLQPVPSFQRPAEKAMDSLQADLHIPGQRISSIKSDEIKVEPSSQQAQQNSKTEGVAQVKGVLFCYQCYHSIYSIST